MHILVTGATGLIGQALTHLLIARGDTVSGLSRTEQPAQKGVTWIVGDSTRPNTYHDAVKRADAVVNLAGAPIAKRWTKAYKSAVRASRVETTRALVSALGKEGTSVQTLISASAVGFYGYDAKSPEQTESSPLGEGFLAEVTRDWEEAAQRALPKTIRLVMPRFGVVLAQKGGALVPMSQATRFGVGGAVGDGAQPFSWIHLEDAARMIIFLLDHKTLSGAVNCVAPKPTTQGALFAALGQALNRPVWLRAPRWAVRLALGQLGEEALIGGQRALGQKAAQAGFQWNFPNLNDALKNLLAPSKR